jgi:hypothetical protein
VTLGELWEEMERAPAPHGEGRLLRRIHPDAAADLHVGLVKPGDQRLITITLPHEVCPSGERLPSTKGTRSGLGTPRDDGHIPVELRLVDPAAKDVFVTLADDVTTAAAAAGTHAGAIDAWIARLRRWQRLLDRVPSEGLGAEAQLGLYAELWTQRELVAPAVGVLAAVQGWTGPEPALHDFQLRGAALEVKGTAGAQHQVLRISSERQLDETGAAALYLIHLSVDARQGGGETLPEAVEAVRTAARGGSAEGPLEERLGEAGYLDAHAPRYTTGYTLRRVGAYRVEEGFPRIIERDLPDGVGDVRYSVAVTECRDWERELDEVVARLTEEPDGRS